jgi:hypothetical protein
MQGGRIASYDFDPALQSIFEKKYSHLPLIDWKSWLTLTSPQAYESLAIELSGLSSVDNLSERILHERTDPEALTVDVHTFVKFKNENTPLIFCHTSGTSGGKISDLKWYHFSDSLVSQLWAPGMQAIFQSSGLDSNSSAVIFVPSRNKGDGITDSNGSPVIKLYSAEFSQRLALSLINPRSYVLHEFKNYTSTQALAHILSQDHISVVSAPSTTLLVWSDPEKMQKRVKKSLDAVPDDPVVQELHDMIHRKGLERAVEYIQRRLSHILQDATFIFSTTSLSSTDWSRIRSFMGWKRGYERVTNLYVGSEVGPFAASISEYPATKFQETMHVFPLTLPTMHGSSGWAPISRTSRKVGPVFVSRMHDYHPLINIATGDVITLNNQQGLPTIRGEILRAPFPLKTPVTISPLIGKSSGPLYVGGYFDFDTFTLKNPRKILNCLIHTCHVKKSSPLLMIPIERGWELVISSPDPDIDIISCLHSCPHGESLAQALQNHVLHLRIIHEDPVQPTDSRSDILKKVRSGELPKGTLKRWPVYVRYQ